MRSNPQLARSRRNSGGTSAYNLTGIGGAGHRLKLFFGWKASRNWQMWMIQSSW